MIGLPPHLKSVTLLRETCGGTEIYKTIAVGAGPANLGLSVLAANIPALDLVTLEATSKATWHPGMQLPNVNLQTNYLKDLVTMVDPTSPFSVLNFINDRGWNYQAIVANRYGTSRKFYELYLQWASDRLPSVKFNQRVQDIQFVGDSFVVKSNSESRSAHHLVIGTGKTPASPDVGGDRNKQTHSSNFATGFDSKNISGKTIAVIGGGQSGAEIVEFLISKQDEIAKIVWVTGRVNLFPLDDSPFINESYTPSFTKFFHGLDVETRKWLNTQIRFSSDGASGKALDGIYRSIFDITRTEGREDFISIYCGFNLTKVESLTGRELLNLKSCLTDVNRQCFADEIVFATGYKFELPEFLSSFSFENGGVEGVPKISSEFQANWDGPPSNKIFLQNTDSLQLGLADSNLSFIPWRSATIINNILGQNRIELRQETSVIDWSLHSIDWTDLHE